MADKVQIDRDLLERLSQCASYVGAWAPEKWARFGHDTSKEARSVLASCGVTSGATPKVIADRAIANGYVEPAGVCGCSVTFRCEKHPDDPDDFASEPWSPYGTGGVMPGYKPSQDSIPAILSPGGFYPVPEQPQTGRDLMEPLKQSLRPAVQPQTEET